MCSVTVSAGNTEDIDEIMVTGDNAFLESEGDDWEIENCDVTNDDDPGDDEDETDMDGDSVDANNDGLSDNVAASVNTEDNEDISDECRDDSIVFNGSFLDSCGDVVGDSDGREKIDKDNFAEKDTIWLTELSAVVFNRPWEEDATNTGEDAFIRVKFDEGELTTDAKVRDMLGDTTLTITFREFVSGICVVAFDSSIEWEKWVVPFLIVKLDMVG